MDQFESIAKSLAPERDRTLILVEAPDEAKLEQALRIAAREPTSTWEYERLTEGFPAVILIGMEPRAAGQTVIRLLERGFSKIVAVYPRAIPENAHSTEGC
jgi:hypothetical protein